MARGDGVLWSSSRSHEASGGGKGDASVEDGKGRTVAAILDAVEQSGVIARLKNALVLKDADGGDGSAGGDSAAGAAAGAT